jgi:hypothetical protein
MNDYGPAARLLHRFALGSTAVRQISYDLDQIVGRAIAPYDRQVAAGAGRHVFICGLARAGTSILLQILHETGEFSSLTYRDMPFVLAPRLWRRIGRSHRVPASYRERAHRDGLNVSFDSPEAFEEVFWITFADEHYLRPDRLQAHELDSHLTALFRRYVAALLISDGKGAISRYLSKNNNNVLRIATLRGAFPDATIVIPFRNPNDHAQSLWRQHRNFCELHNSDAFARDYMAWLGHFEFGLDHKPFAFSHASAARDQQVPPDTPAYWLNYWTMTYEGILATADSKIVFFDFDELCSSPPEALARLAKRVELSSALLDSTQRVGATTAYPPIDGVSQEDVQRAKEIYTQLTSRNRAPSQ